MAAGSGDAAGAPRVKCPSCRTPCVYAPSNKWRPFCSERCRSIDLGAWASERYRVSAQSSSRQETDAAEDAPLKPHRSSL
jgi:endogenous inhibitor of DNA gyrase (YacG/DUF329 family)